MARQTTDELLQFALGQIDRVSEARIPADDRRAVVEGAIAALRKLASALERGEPTPNVGAVVEHLGICPMAIAPALAQLGGPEMYVIWLLENPNALRRATDAATECAQTSQASQPMVRALETLRQLRYAMVELLGRRLSPERLLASVAAERGSPS